MSKSKWADPSGSVTIRRVSGCLRALCLSVLFPVVTFAQMQFVGRQDNKRTFFVPSSVAVDAAGNVFEGDVSTSNIYKLDQFGNQTVVAGAAGLFSIAIDSAGNLYYTAFGSALRPVCSSVSSVLSQKYVLQKRLALARISSAVLVHTKGFGR
jgi:hypothetical protein